MEPPQLLTALATACRPRTPREALVLACHAACLLYGGGDVTPASSWLGLCHEGSEGGFPVQHLVVQSKEGEGDAGSEDEICIKPWGGEGGGGGGGGGGEPALLLYGRRRRLDAAAVHRLDLSVPVYVSDNMQEEDKDCVPIPSQQGGVYACRFAALAARLVTHFLRKLRPELYLAQQLPCFTDVMRVDDRGGSTNNALYPSSSSSSSSLLLDELLPFLALPAVGRLAQTARQYHHPLSDGERAWKTLLARDYPSSLRSASSSSSSSSTPTAPESSRAQYRRCQALARRLPPPRLYRPEDWEVPIWRPLGPSPHHPNYPPLGGGGWVGGGSGVARPRYLPPIAIVLPPFLQGGGGWGRGGFEDDDIQLWG